MNNNININKNIIYAKNILKKLKIKEIKKYHMNWEYIGKGLSGRVYKGLIDNTPIAIKKINMKFNLPLIKKFTMTEIISQQSINETIIANLLSKYNHPTIQKFYGYYIYKHSVYIIREWCEYDFKTFMNNNFNNDEIISNILLHIILSIKLHFQTFIEGYMLDIKLDNILIKKYEKPYATYKLFGKDYNIKTFGYIPVLTDFGISICTKIGNDKLLITCFGDWKKEQSRSNAYDKRYYDILNMEKIPANYILDKSLDLFIFFFNGIYLNENKLKKNYMIKSYIEQLKNIGINSIDDYKDNSLTIDDFLKNINIDNHIYNYAI